MLVFICSVVCVYMRLIAQKYHLSLSCFQTYTDQSGVGTSCSVQLFVIYFPVFTKRRLFSEVTVSGCVRFGLSCHQVGGKKQLPSFAGVVSASEPQLTAAGSSRAAAVFQNKVPFGISINAPLS
ncbi:unnamed protein product [Protopolystoma xenopodis]|uniref:Secreted protein n=1 Tax=Protopolystoma xenopodis TaxID=117903 RepID=A0A3S5BIT7_9PLAT|nr:unnamed protein product [Protopolystoma xenopodis]